MKREIYYLLHKNIKLFATPLYPRFTPYFCPLEAKYGHAGHSVHFLFHKNIKYLLALAAFEC